jgi:tetratricopeptide (TPR) repeat protein
VSLWGDDVDILVQHTAETIVGQVNPLILAWYRYDHNEYEKAAEVIQQIIQNPFSDRRYKTAAFALWGYLLEDQGKHGEAIAKYQKAIELDPKDGAAYYAWGYSLEHEGKYDEAVSKFQKSTELYPQEEYTYEGLGVTLEHQGKHGEAIAAYHKAIELDPTYGPNPNGLGHERATKGDLEGALKDYTEAIFGNRD